MNNELQIIGPKRTGLLDQFETMGWKFYSNRFGPYGEAFHGQRHITDNLRKKVIRAGTKFRRKLEGKNGWLWWTVFRKMGEIHRLERDIAENHLRIPPPTLWRRIGLYLFFGYVYPKSEPWDDEYDYDEYDE